MPGSLFTSTCIPSADLVDRPARARRCRRTRQRCRQCSQPDPGHRPGGVGRQQRRALSRRRRRQGGQAARRLGASRIPAMPGRSGTAPAFVSPTTSARRAAGALHRARMQQRAGALQRRADLQRRAHDRARDAQLRAAATRHAAAGTAALGRQRSRLARLRPPPRARCLAPGGRRAFGHRVGPAVVALATTRHACSGASAGSRSAAWS